MGREVPLHLQVVIDDLFKHVLVHADKPGIADDVRTLQQGESWLQERSLITGTMRRLGNVDGCSPIVFR
jgi:hypothetical protein